MNQFGTLNNRILSEVGPPLKHLEQGFGSHLPWLLRAGRQRWLDLVILSAGFIFGLSLIALSGPISHSFTSLITVAGWFFFGSSCVWIGYRLQENLQSKTDLYQQVIKDYHQIMRETSDHELLLERLTCSLYEHLRLQHLSLWRYQHTDRLLALSGVEGTTAPFTELPVDVDPQQLQATHLVADLPESALSQGLATLGIQSVMSLRLGNEFLGLVGLGGAPICQGRNQEVDTWLDLIAGQLALAVKSAYLITDLEEALNNLQLAYRRTVEAEEDQRRHLAVELHDDILSRLTMMALTLRNSRKQLAGNSNPAPKWIELLEIEVQSVSSRLREITQGLYPSVLTDLGLLSALQAYVDTLTRQPGAIAIPCTVTLTAQGFNGHRLEQQNLERDLYYVTRQALDNALTHAHTDQVFIHLRWREDTVSMTVQDTGCGMKAAPERLMGQNGRLGLLSMNERVLAWRGRLTFRTAPGEGTTVHVRLPTSHPSPDPTHLQIFSQTLQPH